MLCQYRLLSVWPAVWAVTFCLLRPVCCLFPTLLRPAVYHCFLPAEFSSFFPALFICKTTSSFNYGFTLKWRGAQDTDSVETIVLCWIMIKWPEEQRPKSSEYSSVMLNYGPESLSKRDNCITNWITLNNDWSWMAWRAISLDSREDNCMTLTDN